LNKDLVQKYFKKEFNKELRTDIEKKRAQIEEEREEKERVTKRTFKIKDEILLKDYIPYDKNNSIMGKSYREAKDKFEKLGKTFKRGGRVKNRTKTKTKTKTRTHTRTKTKKRKYKN
jgi:hypothetical protein